METLKNVKMCKALFPHKKGQFTLQAVIVGAILIGGGYLLATSGILGGGQKLNVAQTGGATNPAVVQATATGCNANNQVSFQASTLNSLNSSAQYVATTTHIVPKNIDGTPDFASGIAYTTASTSTLATAVTLNCGKDYVWYGLATKDGHGSLGPINLGVLKDSVVIKQGRVQAESGITANAYDNVNRAFVYDSSDAINNDFDALGNTFKSITNNSTATAMGVGDQLDWSFKMKSTGSTVQFGDLRTFACVDADKTSYDEPAMYYNNAKLSDVKTSLNGDDQAVLSGYEYCYQLATPVSSTPNELRLVLSAKGGINPSADVAIRVVAESLYLGQDGTTVKKAIFADSNSAELYETTAQTMTIDIS